MSYILYKWNETHSQRFVGSIRSVFRTISGWWLQRVIVSFRCPCPLSLGFLLSGSPNRDQCLDTIVALYSWEHRATCVRLFVLVVPRRWNAPRRVDEVIASTPRSLWTAAQRWKAPANQSPGSFRAAYFRILRRNITSLVIPSGFESKRVLKVWCSRVRIVKTGARWG